MARTRSHYFLANARFATKNTSCQIPSCGNGCRFMPADHKCSLGHHWSATLVAGMACFCPQCGRPGLATDESSPTLRVRVRRPDSDQSDTPSFCAPTLPARPRPIPEIPGFEILEEI